MILTLIFFWATGSSAGDCGTFSSVTETFSCLWTLTSICWTSHCPSWTWSSVWSQETRTWTSSWPSLGRQGVDWGSPSDNLRAVTDKYLQCDCM